MTFVSYAQNYEDLVLWRALKSVENGFYIDIGAADPTEMSVTCAFYERGWSGINVEPTQNYFARLSEQRQRDININAAIGSPVGIMAFYEFASAGLSTVSAEVAQRHIDSGVAHEMRYVPVLPLSSICKQRGDQPIHFLKIDVEGAEREVLLSMDFSVCRPWIVVVEATEPLVQKVNKDAWEHILLDNQYVFAYYDGLNCFYVSEEHKDLASQIAVPPNVFDDFIKLDDLKFRDQAEQWRLEILRLGEQAENWRRMLVDSQDYISALQQKNKEDIERLESGHRNDVSRLEERIKSLGVEFRSLVAQREAEHNDVLSHQIDEIARSTRLLGEVESRSAALQQALAAMHASSSWRMTAPLRGLAERNPTVLRMLRLPARRFPGVGRNGIWLARNAWRLATLRPPVARPPVLQARLETQAAPSLIQSESQPPAIPADPPPHGPILWFHIGDTLEWLNAHQHFTGVGRVTTKILAAALADQDGVRWHLSILQDEGLRRLPADSPVPTETLALAAQGGSATAAELRAVMAHAPAALRDPAPGDHVLFTGVVWTPSYIALFKRLRAQGIRFSVLLYDIIPLQRSDFVGAAHGEAFARFLSLVVQEAEVIFTSASVVRAQLHRWLLADGSATRNKVEVIGFGASLDRSRPPTAVSVVTEPFALCVGTIDRRKNQLLLCRTWVKLAALRPMPVLVLVGRDDIGLHAVDAGISALLDSGAIRILRDVQDSELDALYRAAEFTLFPSFSEGYGLPVADSLAYGKLCLAADLPVIREWAGDLPWYFDPHDAAALEALLLRALNDSSAVYAGRARIAEWQPRPWLETARAIANAVSLHLGVPSDRPQHQAGPVPPPDIGTAVILDHAARWCVADDPEVSIVIVNWNTSAMTTACIRHLWAHTTGVTYEVIVVDNGSPPGGLAVLGNLGHGVRLLSLGVNRFFGEANNIAVEAARGRYICFLNNDVFVSQGWLDGLLRGLREAPSVGAVGPVFLFPDGTIQEAGGMVNPAGFPERYSRGAPASARPSVSDRLVDYISAACLLMPRDLFMQAGGFDLAYEPAYYEDADLCFKLTALGHGIKLIAAVDVIHLEGFSTTDEVIPSARKQALGDLNRGKFVSRWQEYLQGRDTSSLETVRDGLLPSHPIPPATGATPAPPTRRVLMYSHYALTPGGGERYIMTIAAVLAQGSAVTIATPHPYSHIRLLQLGREFGIDLASCVMTTLAEVTGEWDLMIAMGNHVIPPVAARGRHKYFICQFPFPMEPGMVFDPAILAGYDAILAYSDYAKRNIEATVDRHGLAPRPIHVLYPPVPQFPAAGVAKKNIILTVGRFFTGGHSKRHDVLIEAFRTLQAGYEGEVEFHLAGSSIPDAMQMDYLARLQGMAAGMSVTFHVNATLQTLEQLYQDSAFYWHGTGLNGDLKKFPEIAEHFGIAIVEAMSAGCVACALNAGAAPEIITDDVDGYLYDTTEMLVERTLTLLRDPARRDAIGERARRRAADFAPTEFSHGVNELLA